MKTLSIITINLNQGDALKSTLDSILSQTYTDYELIVIDGGSNDHSQQILQKLSAKIDICISEPDKGIYDAQNKGIRNASGRYSIFMNAGDTFYNQNVLSNVFNTVQTDDTLYGDLIRIEKNKTEKVKFPPVMNFLFFHKVGLCPQATFSLTELHRQYPFDTKYKIFADRNFYFQLIKKNHTFKYLNLTVCIYDANGFSNLPENKNRAIEERQNITDQYIPKLIQEDYKHLLLIPEINKLFDDLIQYPRLRKMTSSVLKSVFNTYKAITKRKL